MEKHAKQQHKHKIGILKSGGGGQSPPHLLSQMNIDSGTKILKQNVPAEKPTFSIPAAICPPATDRPVAGGLVFLGFVQKVHAAFDSQVGEA